MIYSFVLQSIGAVKWDFFCLGLFFLKIVKLVTGKNLDFSAATTAVIILKVDIFWQFESRYFMASTFVTFLSIAFLMDGKNRLLVTHKTLIVPNDH